MTDRISCCVPFCRRTFRKLDHVEVVCGKHWRLVSPVLRRRKAKLYRMYRKRFGDKGYWEFPPGSEKRIEAIRLDRLCGEIWKRCRNQAIERAGGI